MCSYWHCTNLSKSCYLYSGSTSPPHGSVATVDTGSSVALLMGTASKKNGSEWRSCPQPHASCTRCRAALRAGSPSIALGQSRQPVPSVSRSAPSRHGIFTVAQCSGLSSGGTGPMVGSPQLCEVAGHPHAQTQSMHCGECFAATVSALRVLVPHARARSLAQSALRHAP
jgi:hypothetical protein